MTFEEQLNETHDQEKSVNINRQMNDTSKYFKTMVMGVIQHSGKVEGNGWEEIEGPLESKRRAPWNR